MVLLQPYFHSSSISQLLTLWSLFKCKPLPGTVKLSRILVFWRRNRSALELRINNLGSVQGAEQVLKSVNLTVPVGVISPPARPLVWFRSQKLGSLQFHRQVQQLLQNVAEGLGPSSINSSKISRGNLSLGSGFIDSPFKTCAFRLENPVPDPCPWRSPGSTSVDPPGLPSWNPLLPGQNSNYRKKVTRLRCLRVTVR